MITMITAFAVSGAAFWGAHTAQWGLGWSITAAVFAFVVFQLVTGHFMKKRITADMMRVQTTLAEGQKRLQAKMQRWQIRPPGSAQAAQKEIFDDTRAFVREALEQTEALSRYRLFVPFIDRQKATAQMQLNWMIKDFDKVDALMPKVLFADPTLVAMRMARMYMKGEDTEVIGKVYRKGARRLRYNQNVLLAATWSWILLKRNDEQGAFAALTEALKSSDDATLKRNHESLMNNRPAHFTNSGLGDRWYALHLEEPRIKTQRQRPVYR